MHLHVERSQPEIHLAMIVRRTFQEAGWEIATEKVLLGLSLDLLGLGLSTQGGGALFMQEAKRQGMLLDIDHQLRAAGTSSSWWVGYRTRRRWRERGTRCYNRCIA